MCFSFFLFSILRAFRRLVSAHMSVEPLSAMSLVPSSLHSLSLCLSQFIILLVGRHPFSQLLHKLQQNGQVNIVHCDRLRLLYVFTSPDDPRYLQLATPLNVDRENSNKVKQEEGVLAVTRIKAQAHNVCVLLNQPN